MVVSPNYRHVNPDWKLVILPPPIMQSGYEIVAENPFSRRSLILESCTLITHISYN